MRDGGDDGIRTHCLYIANVALYQLSYTPVRTKVYLAQGGEFSACGCALGFFPPVIAIKIVIEVEVFRATRARNPMTAIIFFESAAFQMGDPMGNMAVIALFTDKAVGRRIGHEAHIGH